MAMGFFFDVLEVEQIRDVENKRTGKTVTYANLKLAGGSVSIPVKVGLKITPGFAGKACGSVRIQNVTVDFKGQKFNRVIMVPDCIESWVATSPVVASNSNSLDSFLGSKK